MTLKKSNQFKNNLLTLIDSTDGSTVGRCQFLVVLDAEDGANGGHEIDRRDRAFADSRPASVSLADGLTSFDPTTEECRGPGLGIMVATAGSARLRRATEFAHPDDERTIEQSPVREILQ